MTDLVGLGVRRLLLSVDDVGLGVRRLLLSVDD